MAASASEPTAAAWVTRYARYVQESSERAARTAELNRRLLTRVANGELAPTTLDNQFAAFFATNAATYTDDVAETGLEFLTGLIAAGTTYTHELVERIAPGELDTERSEPPTIARGDWTSGLQSLTSFAQAENAAVAALLRALMTKVATGTLSPDGMHASSEEFHGEHLPGTVDELVTLFFDLMTRLEEAHADFGNRALLTVLDLPGETEPGETSLELVAQIGTTASARLAVANNESEPTALRAVMTDVRRSDGIGPAFDPDATIRPARFTLAPLAEEVVTLTVRLAAKAFEPGPEYVGTLHVLSPGSTVLAVPVKIRVAVPVEPDDTVEADKS